MSKKNTTLNGNQNGQPKLPTAKDFRERFKSEILTNSDKELLRASREALDALAEEQAKYGKRLETCL